MKIIVLFQSVSHCDVFLFYYIITSHYYHSYLKHVVYMQLKYGSDQHDHDVGLDISHVTWSILFVFNRNMLSLY